MLFLLVNWQFQKFVWVDQKFSQNLISINQKYIIGLVYLSANPADSIIFLVPFERKTLQKQEELNLVVKHLNQFAMEMLVNFFFFFGENHGEDASLCYHVFRRWMNVNIHAQIRIRLEVQIIFYVSFTTYVISYLTLKDLNLSYFSLNDFSFTNPLCIFFFLFNFHGMSYP